MNALFLYGTLRDRDHLLAVAGDLDGVAIRPGALPGYAVRRLDPLVIPVLVPDADARAEGLILEGLTDAHRARLDFYEGGYDFDVAPRTLADGTRADVYIPPASAGAPEAPWRLEDWQAGPGPEITLAAHEVMSYFGAWTAEKVARRMGPIRARAAARLRAGRTPDDGTFRGQVDIPRAQRSYSKFYALDDLTIRHSTFSGGTSGDLDRAVFVTADAVIVLPYDPVRERVLLVEQIRMGPLGRGDPNLWHLEPIAGRIDPGETPERAALREAREEAGLTLGPLHEIARVYASPGNATEFHYIFVARADLPNAAAGLGGAADEGEDIRAHLVPLAELLEMTRDFRAANAPLVLAALWLAQNRSALA
ncbi:MAG: NUDIX domain-containing protein [Pseudomonadota bacterium]